MANTMKVLRSVTAGTRPTGRSYGELWLNEADRVLGFIDNAGNAVDLFGVSTDAGGIYTTILGTGATPTTANHIEVTGAIATKAPKLTASGSDANVDFELHTTGTGAFNLYTGGGLQVQIYDAGASCVNFLTLGGSTIGTPVTLGSASSDSSADVGIQYFSQGAGTHDFVCGGDRQFVVLNADSTVNYIGVYGGGAGLAPAFQTYGTDASVNMAFKVSGPGQFLFRTGEAQTGTTVTGTNQFIIEHKDNAVNFVSVTGGGLNEAATVAAKTDITSAVQDVDLFLAPSGAGRLQLGASTKPTADAPVKGYIEVKDLAGNIVKLAVIG